jgi:twitching motility protein PilI
MDTKLSPYPSPAQGIQSRYGFRVGGVQLVPAHAVLTEMVNDAVVNPVPKASHAVMGVLNLRGSIVPVFDPQALGKARADIHPKLYRALVFDRDEQSLGLLLDSDPELLLLESAPGTPVPPDFVWVDYLTRPWVRQDQPQQVWWEINHRAAFEFLARVQATSSQTVSTTSIAHHTKDIL